MNISAAACTPGALRTWRRISVAVVYWAARGETGVCEVQFDDGGLVRMETRAFAQITGERAGKKQGSLRRTTPRATCAGMIQRPRRCAVRVEAVCFRSRAGAVCDARHAGHNPASSAAPRLIVVAKRKIRRRLELEDLGQARAGDHADETRAISHPRKAPQVRPPAPAAGFQ